MSPEIGMHSISHLVDSVHGNLDTLGRQTNPRCPLPGTILWRGARLQRAGVRIRKYQMQKWASKRRQLACPPSAFQVLSVSNAA